MIRESSQRSDHFLDPPKRPLFGASLERVPEELISLLLNKISWCIPTFTSIRSFTLLLTHYIEQTSYFFHNFLLILDPLPETLFGGPLWRGSPEELIFSHFRYFWIKFHDAFIHLLQSDHSLCFSLITLNKHLIFFTIFCSFWTPYQRPLFGASLERVPEELIFFTTSE